MQKTERVSVGCACQMQSESVEECTEKGRLKLANGETLRIISASCTIEILEGKRNLDVQKGFVGSREVKVLRDTGCGMVAVRRDLVRKDQLLE